VEKELDYISTLYPFDLRPHFDYRMLYTQALTCLSPVQDDTGNSSFGTKLVSLAAGIELLGLGCYFHRFNLTQGSRSTLDPDHNQYTLDLLLGDILYSRAVNYLVKFEDMLIFDEVINSLKSMHQSRLHIYQQITEGAKEGLPVSPVVEDDPYLLGLNSLFKNCFLIGYSIFPPPWPRDVGENIANIYGYVNHITLLKSCVEMEGWLKLLECGGQDILQGKINNILNQLQDLLGQLDLKWLQQRWEKMVSEVGGRY